MDVLPTKNCAQHQKRTQARMTGKMMDVRRMDGEYDVLGAKRFAGETSCGRNEWQN